LIAQANGTLQGGVAAHPIAVDALGGDKPLDAQIEGAIQAKLETRSNPILVGPQNDINDRLHALGADHLEIAVCHAPQSITMDESPARAVRKKPDSSLCVAYRLVESGDAEAVISAGSSGAMMAAGRIICGQLPGIERPAIAALIPGPSNSAPNVLLDSGANVDCHAMHLVQFAVMGSVYYSSLFSKESPKVALLSNGTEASKGNDLIRNAAAMLKHMPNLNYVGYIEGRDLTSDKADVIVCDGFSGNIVLKAMEGCVRVIFDHLRHEGQKGLVSRMGMWLSRNLYRNVFRGTFDYTAYGGAPLLGLNRLALVLHGSSDARAVKNAINVADIFAESHMVEKLENELTKLDEQSFEENIDIASGMLGGDSSILGNGANNTPKTGRGRSIISRKAAKTAAESDKSARR
jgi:glycerol-3-phosphate acyltransferase PlsX